METDVKVNVIKRNGEEVSFDLLKIANAIKAANQEVAPIYQLNEYQIQAIADNVAAKISEMTHACPCRGYPGYGGDGYHGDARLRSSTEICKISL